MRTWIVILILSAAQFVMVLDTTVMNVAISQVVEDLDTTVSSMQLAITAYTLVMAAFMLVGGRLGDILGRRRVFAIGLAVYACGSLLTALSPNLAVLLVGWSFLEGLGAAMVIPAIAALTAANYEGRERAICYGILGGVAGAGAAVGPLVGGWATTELSWRVVFAAEVVIILGVLAVVRLIKDAPREGARPRLDWVGGLLSAGGLALIVFGILQSSQWGWVQPKSAPTIGGVELTPLGFSLVPFLIMGGAVLLGLFALWEARRERRGEDPLLRLALLRVDQLRGGLTMLGIQQFIIMGTFFVLPLYLQVVLGKDALETGIAILPLSVAMFAAALGGSSLSSRISPRRVVQAGMILLFAGEVVLLSTIDVELNAWGFGLGLALVGLGVGLLASQLGNVIMSSVPVSRSSEAGGLQGTAQNLGASLGTALIGSILLAGLTGSFQARVEQSSTLPPEVKSQVATRTEEGIDFAPSATVETVAEDAGLPPAQVDELVAGYEDSQLDALRRALGAAALFVVVGFWFTRRLPARRLGEVDAAAEAPRAPPAPA